MKETKYIAICLGIGFGLMAMICTLNFVVNPFGIYAPPVIKGFNDYYPASNAFPRLHKIESVKKIKPDVVIIGSSRADSGMNPTPEFFGDTKVYNLGLPASTIYEQRRLLEFAQMVHPLKQVIITLDFFTFNATRLENKQFEPDKLTKEALSPLRGFFNTYGTIASLDTFTTSLKHIRYLRKPDRYSYATANGFKRSLDVEYKISQIGAGHRFVADPNAEAVAGQDNGFSFNYSDDPADTTVQHFDAMLDFTRQQGIEVILVISPMHKIVFDNMQTTGSMADFLYWKKRIADITTANAVRFAASSYPLWDFATVNTYTQEPVPAADDATGRMQYFYDGSHYKAPLGDMIFRRILGKDTDQVADDFGNLVLSP
jgi:hypothetical protein